MCRTHEIAKELDVTLLKRLKGSQVLDVPEEGSIPDGVYLVEQGGEKFVLKTGGFNKNEAEDNWRLADLGIPVRLVTESVEGEYILYEYIDAPVLASLDFWSDDKMQAVLDLHNQIEAPLNVEAITDEEVKSLVSWVENRPLGKWLPESTNNPWTEDEIEEFRKVFFANEDLWSKPENMERAAYDTHAENYLWREGELVVMDADITTIPRYYTDMRYLAWVILKMPPEQVSMSWIKRWADKLGKDRSHLFTFFVSMLGIMWDMHGNEKHRGEHVEKTEIVKQTIYWLKDELKKEETNE